MSTPDRPAENRHLREEREEYVAGPDAPLRATALRPHVGINWGAAFFGSVTALGLGVMLTAIAVAVGAATGVTTRVTDATSVSQAADVIAGASDSVTLGSGILLALIVLLAYYCGGYVAARMSRFEGVRQGFGVWVWAVIFAAVVAVVAAVAGSRYDILSRINAFPRLPVRQGDLTTAGIIALAVVLVLSLAGALLGGQAGMRYHRRLEVRAVEEQRVVEEQRPLDERYPD